MALTPGSFERFFLPGPTGVREEILEAQVAQMIGHRGADVQALMRKLQEGLRELFKTERPVFVSTSSATGLMEAAVRNGARERVLSLVNGAFSQRFAVIARACGFEVETMEVPWGAAHEPEDVRRRLREGRFDAVTVVHSETSTGVLNPVDAIAAVVGAFGDTVLLVDSVTGVGGAPLYTDHWGLDFVLTGSQKALALPPGLAFGVASPTMMERSASATRKGVYFDLVEFQRYIERDQTPSTPALSTMFALREQLEAIHREGLEARWGRHAAMAARCWQWVDDLREHKGVGVSVLAPKGHRSPTVTCIELPEGGSGSGVAAAMRERGWVIGAGYGKLKEPTIRVGHMGDHTVAELNELLDALGEVLQG